MEWNFRHENFHAMEFSPNNFPCHGSFREGFYCRFRCFSVECSIVMTPSREIIDELVRRIREVVEPLQIILFGSAAQEAMNRDSDLDVLVVVKDGLHRRKIAEQIYVHLLGFPVATDVVVATSSDFARHRENWSLVYYDALRKGQVIYRAAA